MTDAARPYEGDTDRVGSGHGSGGRSGFMAVLERHRWAHGAAGVLVGLALFARVGPRPELLGEVLVLAVMGPALSVLDLRFLRLPDVIVLPGAALLVPTLVGSAALRRGGWALLERAASGSAVTLLLLGTLAYCLGDALGWGDVKAAGLLLAPLCSWVGWSALVSAGLLAFTMAAAGLLAGRGPARHVALGPYLFVATLAVLLWWGPPR